MKLTTIHISRPWPEQEILLGVPKNGKLLSAHVEDGCAQVTILGGDETDTELYYVYWASCDAPQWATPDTFLGTVTIDEFDYTSTYHLFATRSTSTQ